MSALEFLTVVEVAALLRAPVTSVRDWLRLGKIASYKVGKRLIVKRDDVLAFVEAGKRPGVAG